MGGTIKYFITKGDQFGKRLFRWDQENNVVTQVVVECGEKKTGRPNMLGIYNVSEATLTGNYLWQLRNSKNPNISETTHRLFYYWFDQVVRRMRRSDFMCNLEFTGRPCPVQCGSCEKDLI